MKKLLLKMCTYCSFVWICTLPVALGTIVITDGDFTRLGTLLEKLHVSEHYMFVKTMLNIGLDLHICTALPAAFAFIEKSKNTEKVKK